MATPRCPEDSTTALVDIVNNLRRQRDRISGVEAFVPSLDKQRPQISKNQTSLELEEV